MDGGLEAKINEGGKSYSLFSPSAFHDYAASIVYNCPLSAICSHFLDDLCLHPFS